MTVLLVAAAVAAGPFVAWHMHRAAQRLNAADVQRLHATHSTRRIT